MKAIQDVRAAHALHVQAIETGHPTLIRLAMRDLKRAYATLAALGAALAMAGSGQAAELPAYGSDDAEHQVYEVSSTRPLSETGGEQCHSRELEQGSGRVIVCERVSQ
jgi:hypothetical protein